MRELHSTNQKEIRAYLLAELARLRPGDSALLDDLERRLAAGGLLAVLALLRYFRHDAHALSMEARSLMATLRARLALSTLAEGFAAKHRPDKTPKRRSGVRESRIALQRYEKSARLARELGQRLTKDGLGLNEHAEKVRQIEQGYQQLATLVHERLAIVKATRATEERISANDREVRRLQGRRLTDSGRKLDATTGVALALDGILSGKLVVPFTGPKPAERRRLIHAVVVALLDDALRAETLRLRFQDAQRRGLSQHA